MLAPPVMPASALTGGKIAVGLSWLFAIAALLLGDATGGLHKTGFWLLIFLGGSHALEVVIYREFLQRAGATAADYLQVLLFGIFHSGGLKRPE